MIIGRAVSRRARLGLESRTVSTSVAKVLKVHFLVALAKPVAPLLFESRRIHLGRESPEKLFLKSRHLHVGLESRADSI